MKFKVGDRVVVHKLEPSASLDMKVYIGKTCTITDVAKSDFPYFVDGAFNVSFGPTEIEHEAVYFSPLYEALK